MGEVNKEVKATEKTMDRRSFLMGGTAAGVMALAGTALAGCASGEPAESQNNSTSSNETSDTKPAMGNSAPIEPVSVPAAWDAEADIIIVGAGGGGLNAASRASQEGLSAIVVEKLPTTGGNTQSATMYTCPGNSKIQNEAERAIPEYPFDIKKWTDFIMGGMGQGANLEMLETIGSNLGPCFDWMTDTYDLKWQLGFDGSFMAVAPVGMTLITDAARTYAEENGAEFMLGAEAEALVMDGDRVVGLQVQNSKGDEVYLRGTKAVLLCGGGFSANKDLLAEYCPSAMQRARSCYMTNTDQGDCLRMGLGAGAGVINRDSYVMFDGGMDWENYGGEWCRYLYDGSTQVVRQPWLSFDVSGNRIRYIDSKVHGALTDQAVASTATPGNGTYIVFDKNWDEYMQTFGQVACRMPIQDGVDRQSMTAEYYQDYHAGMQDAIDAGIIRKADTLEELAEKMNIDAGVLKSTVSDWNATCEKGEDDFIYPLPSEWLYPVAEPPFYGAIIGGNIFSTSTGLHINKKMQVVSTDGSVIPGLYAGWHAAGGAGSDTMIGSMSFDTGGVSRSYLGGYLAMNAIVAEEK